MGRVLREYLGEIKVADSAARLGFADSLSRVLHGQAGISAEMSLRLADALGTHAAFCSGMQMEYELWQAGRKPRPRIVPFGWAA